jgi:RNA polymerase sigma-70 factor (ECF subfamily)
MPRQARRALPPPLSNRTVLRRIYSGDARRADAMIERGVIGRSMVGVNEAGAIDARDVRDVQLVGRARSGDLAAFDALVSARLDRIFRLCSTILGDPDRARDATQETFLAVWRQLARLDDPLRFDGWLTRIAVNACRMQLRARRTRVRELPMDDGDGWHPAWESEHDAGIQAVAERDAVDRAFAHLDPTDRALVVLHHIEDRPLAEIAASLEVPVGTVKWRLHEARKVLRAALDGEVR